MKRETLKHLLSEIVKAVLREDTDADLKKAKTSVAKDLKLGKEPSRDAAQLAVNSIDKSEKDRIANKLNSTTSSPLAENDEGSSKSVSLMLKIDLKTKEGTTIEAGETLPVEFRNGRDSHAFVKIDGRGLKTYVRVPITLLHKYFKGCQAPPSERTLEKWNNDGRCKTVLGSVVEPDGHDQYGAPSWLLVFGVI